VLRAVSLTKIPVQGECVRASVSVRVSVHACVGVNTCSCDVHVHALVQVGTERGGVRQRRARRGGMVMSTDSVVQ
jgi:hypothetical protein